jgi:hypothetical protein
MANCSNCGRKISSPESVRRGLGPQCAKNGAKSKKKKKKKGAGKKRGGPKSRPKSSPRKAKGRAKPIKSRKPKKGKSLGKFQEIGPTQIEISPADKLKALRAEKWAKVKELRAAQKRNASKTEIDKKRKAADEAFEKEMAADSALRNS